MTNEKKKRVTLSSAWRDARDLVWSHRYRLGLGMLLMIVNRLVGLVLPASSKYLIDDVIIKHQGDLLIPLALAAGGATVIQAISSFALSQVLGVAAQRAITDMRKSVQEHVARLPVRYFDSTQTGILISRIMTDAEGIRNLVGTGLVQLIGGLVTAMVGPRRALLFKLAADLDHPSRSICFRRLHGAGLYTPATPLSRARSNKCRSDRASGRVARRHPHCQSLLG